MQTTALESAAGYAPQEWKDFGTTRVPAHYGTVADEYQAARSGLAVVDRAERGLLKIGGEDRASWLHNLVTNAVTTLDVHMGNYAFAADVRGRTLFDLNMLILPDEIWIDLPRIALGLAGDHFDRHLITEDVTITNASDDVLRIGVCGAQAGACLQQRGSGQLQAMPDLGLASFGGDATLFRHDFAGQPGFELIVEREQAVGVWNDLVEQSGATPVGYDAIDCLRIEAGIPWFGRDIDEQVLPPETGQIERGISYHKGCYLGQEVIERMRAYGSMARHLLRLRMEDGATTAEQTELMQDGKKVGRITSLRKHPIDAGWIGLGYLKTNTQPNNLQAGEDGPPVEIAT